MNGPRLRADVRHPGPRYREQGACSGEQFREDVLIPQVRKSLARGETLLVELEDARFGYPTGWLEEVFGGLVRKIPGTTPAEVTPVSVNHPEAAAEAIGYMRKAALHGADSDR